MKTKLLLWNALAIVAISLSVAAITMDRVKMILWPIRNFSTPYRLEICTLWQLKRDGTLWGWGDGNIINSKDFPLRWRERPPRAAIL